jgi:hypothetical protein
MIGAFVGYDTLDEPFLEELKNTVREFGELLKQTWNYWKNWYDTWCQKPSESK